MRNTLSQSPEPDNVPVTSPCFNQLVTAACGAVPTKSRNEDFVSAFLEKLAATYSRRTYRTTTIGKTVFDGRVRNGNGSDHSSMATKKTEVRDQKSEVRNLCYGT